MLALFNVLAAADATQTGQDSILIGMDAKMRFVLTLTAIGCVTMFLMTISTVALIYGDRGHRRKLAAELKREMLDRGLTADEIATVIEAGEPPDDLTGSWSFGCCSKNRKSALAGGGVS